MAKLQQPQILLHNSGQDGKLINLASQGLPSLSDCIFGIQARYDQLQPHAVSKPLQLK